MTANLLQTPLDVVASPDISLPSQSRSPASLNPSLTPSGIAMSFPRSIQQREPQAKQAKGQQAKQAKGQRYIWLKTLAVWLLWGTSRSSHEVMRLLDGQTARISCPNQVWQTGVLRLIPFLSLRCPTDRSIDLYTVDLISDHLIPTGMPRVVLPLDAKAYFDSAICQQPASLATLLHSVREQIQQTTPTLTPYLQGLAAQVRLPQQLWRSSTVQLHYRLEFTPLLPAPTALSPLIKVADANWLQQYDAAIHRQQLTYAVSEVARQAIANNCLPSAGLVAQACALSDRLQNDLAIVSRLFTLQELELRELLFRLRWSLLHSSYAGTQLFQGITATVLSAQDDSFEFQLMGKLRFAVHLQLRSGRQVCKLDVMTGQRVAQPSRNQSNRDLPIPLLPTTIVQSRVCAWCQAPRSLQQLQERLWQQIHTHTPELELLRQATPIALYQQSLSPCFSPAWRSGTMQLMGQFEFTVTAPVQPSAESGN
jgi:hypothetical protein